MSAARKVDARARVVGARRASGGSPARDAGQGADHAATAADEPTVASPRITAEMVEAARERTVAERAAQGLPPQVEDEATYARLGRLFYGHRHPKAGAA